MGVQVLDWPFQVDAVEKEVKTKKSRVVMQAVGKRVVRHGCVGVVWEPMVSGDCLHIHFLLAKTHDQQDYLELSLWL